MSDWQLIETAPLDGTYIDVWSESDGRTTDAYFGGKYPGINPISGSKVPLPESDLELRWRGDWGYPINPPSHWMLRPDDPIEQETE